MNPPADNLLSEFFAPNVDTADVPALFPLLRAKDALSAFITLFRGGDEEVLIRLLVLREMGSRPGAPRWSRSELDQHFAYLDPVKLETVLKRLRENGLLSYGDEGLYQLSTSGRNATTAIGMLLQFAGGDDAELGYITSQVAGLQAVGKVSAEALQHLLSRLTELQESFEQAIVSGSEFRIRAAQAKLDSVWSWIEKGTDIMRAITADEEIDSATHRIAQAIGLAQSKMTRTHAAFQRALNRLDQQRVHLGSSGLSSTDIALYLCGQSQKNLADLLDGALPALTNGQFFSMPDDVLDIAEFELLERVREKEEETVLPESTRAPETTDTEGERLLALENYLSRLHKLPEAATLDEAVIGGDYPLAAYRLSLLALLGDPESETLAGPVADLARLPFALSVSGNLTKIERDGVAEISEGTLTRHGN